MKVNEYKSGSAPITIDVPALTVAPSTCKITYVITIPKAIKDIATVKDDGDIKIGGATLPDMIGKHEFSVQVKTPGGVEIEGAKYTINLTILKAEKKEKGGELITTVSTLGAIASSAAGAAAMRGPPPTPTRGGPPPKV